MRAIDSLVLGGSLRPTRSSGSVKCASEYTQLYAPASAVRSAIFSAFGVPARMSSTSFIIAARSSTLSRTLIRSDCSLEGDTGPVRDADASAAPAAEQDNALHLTHLGPSPFLSHHLSVPYRERPHTLRHINVAPSLKTNLPFYVFLHTLLCERISRTALRFSSWSSRCEYCSLRAKLGLWLSCRCSFFFYDL